MPSNNPPSIGMQLDRCQVCGNKIHRRELVRTQVEHLIPKAENYFLYSSYNAAYWTVDTASDAGNISYGNRCDHVRLQVPSTQPTAAGAMTYLNGVQTWEGDGVYRSFVLSPSSGDTNAYVTMSAQVGPHAENTSPSMVVNMGICNSDGTSLSKLRTWNISTMKRVWFKERKPVLEALQPSGGLNSWYFYIEIINDGKWWIDEAQMEIATTDGSPEVFIETTGSYVSQAESGGIATRKVCPNCFEGVFRKSERFGKSDEPQVDYPVSEHVQEF